jgi:hypothetical protein
MVRLLLRYIFSKFQNSPHHLCVEFPFCGVPIAAEAPAQGGAVVN